MTVAKVAELLPKVVAQQRVNAEKIQTLMDYSDGSRQKIDAKTRENILLSHESHIVKENPGYTMVTFKEGFLLGQKKDISHKENVDHEELKYLDRYLSDVSFHKHEIIVKNNVYACGVGVSYVAHRTDIIRNIALGRAKFKNEREGYDVENDAPFIYEAMNPRKNAVVYTDLIGQRDKDLFCFSIKSDNFYGSLIHPDIQVWTREWRAVFSTKDGKYAVKSGTLKKHPQNLQILPMTEFSLNENRVGIIEISKYMIDALQFISSTAVDNLDDLVNQLLVFINADVDEIDARKAKEAGALAIGSRNNLKAELISIVAKLDYKSVMELFEQIETRMYDMVGVAKASTKSSSGGDTGEARMLGGGWHNARIVANRDILSFEDSDRAELKKMVAVCRTNPDNPIRELSVNQLNIKYNMTLSDNILAKTQSMQNLNDIGFPLEDILKAVPIVNDISSVAKRWKEEKERMLMIEYETEKSLINAQTEKSTNAQEVAEKPKIAEKGE